jgi:uncharacterized protein YyaL (SSP411 family)
MNQLQHESSPYLLQHAHNPVDWYAWKPEAFERARREQKPIIVSIGYSTCHWCHVMERESFENPDVAALMNEHFINIKVDREERPDVDAIYMEACQLLTGGGGWPLNCFLTPEGKPFYAGTYFPPQPAYNRPSWPQLLAYLADIWENKRDTALDQAEKLTGHIQKGGPLQGRSPMAPDKAIDLEKIRTQIKRQYDLSEGGFGGAPKFPSSMAIQFLLECYEIYRDPEAIEHALFTLEKMISGGIYDQVGGGFARYTTDRAWMVPHFEKMLYDNALLISVLSNACQLVNDKRLVPQGLSPHYSQIFRETIEETLAYVAREMTSADGGFYSAQDADSEGVEGKFYVWEQEELETLLGEKAAAFCAYYGVAEQGNWEEKNILHRTQAPALHGQFERERQILLQHRSQRIWPLLDTKILLDWNALMCSAYAQAYLALGQEAYKDAAVKNISFVLKQLRMPATAGHLPGLKHSITQEYAFLDDYAFFIAALLDVYEITFEPQYAQLASQYQAYVLEEFGDPSDALLFFAGTRQTDILLRKKDIYDNATPSGNSVMALNLQRLGLLMHREDWLQQSKKMLEAMQQSVENFPLSMAKWNIVFLRNVFPAAEIAIVGDNARQKATFIQRSFLSNKIISASNRSNEDIPLLAGKDGGTDAYIYLCRDFACQKPVVSLEEFWDSITPPLET